MAAPDIARMRLRMVQRDGSIEDAPPVPEFVAEICRMGAEYFEKTGFVPPWVAYVAFAGGQCVGTCAFKSAPVDGAVEISYMTLEEQRCKGHATEMVRLMVQIARQAHPSIILRAQTMPGPNASTRVLGKSGFVHTGDQMHPEDGLVSEWRLPVAA